MRKRLALRRETLAELTTDDLHRVAGADGTVVTCYTAVTVCGLCDTGAIWSDYCPGTASSAC